MTIDVDGPVHVADFGGSGPPLLLVHGLAGSHLNWLSVAPALARRYRVFALDLPGFGRTPLAGRVPTIAESVEVVANSIDLLAAGSAGLVGNSMGGLVSLGVAATHPERVRSLVLVDPAMPLPRGQRPAFDQVSRRFLAAAVLPRWGARRLSRVAERIGAETIVRETFRLCTVDPSRVDPAVVAAHLALETERMAEHGWHEPFYAATRSLIGTLARRRRIERWVRAVWAPTLLLHGDGDALVSVRSARAVADVRPDWEFHMFAGVGHIPMLEAPEQFLEVVSEWLESLDRPSAAASERSEAAG